MKIISNQNINLRSASSPGGLVHVKAKTPTLVPDDVAGKSFNFLIKHGVVSILKSKIKAETAVPLAPPTIEPNKLDSAKDLALDALDEDDEDDEDEEETDEDEDEDEEEDEEEKKSEITKK
jgi:hypothetical protein